MGAEYMGTFSLFVYSSIDMKLCVDDVLPVIFRFLINSGFVKAAKEIQKSVESDLSEAKCPLHKKKLMNI